MLLLYILGWLIAVQLLNFISSYLPRQLSKVIHWIHAMTFEVFAFIGVAILRFIPASSFVSGQGTPILLVHGYVNHGSVWMFQKRRLEKAGFGPIYTINLGHPFKSICEYAETVKVKADEIANETNRKDLILIGHSMGGLVSSWYALNIAESDTVTDVITIGTPLTGTPVARIGVGPNAREMEPNSKFLQELQSSILKNQSIRFHHIATLRDQLVIPGHSAIMKGNNNFVIEDLGHASLLYSTRVTTKLCEWLYAIQA